METYYTTKQVQDLFKVDRITVYRMLQDGRLKGVKIGNQWRFPQREVERLLHGVELAEDVQPDSVFPIHCVQTIQNLYVSVSQFHALVIDSQGEPVTEFSKNAPFCQLMHTSPEGRAFCQSCWKQFTEEQKEKLVLHTCQAGISYYGAAIENQNKVQGIFLSGQFFDQPVTHDELTRRGQELAEECHLDAEKLLAAMQEIPTISDEQKKQLQQHPLAAAEAIESILQERSGFLDRLQQIADLTQRL